MKYYIAPIFRDKNNVLLFDVKPIMLREIFCTKKDAALIHSINEDIAKLRKERKKGIKALTSKRDSIGIDYINFCKPYRTIRNCIKIPISVVGELMISNECYVYDELGKAAHFKNGIEVE